MGLPHSKTLARRIARFFFREVLEWRLPHAAFVMELCI
jgi:hypothetical protein